MAPGVVTTQLSSVPPASSSATEVPGSSESRLATAQPPEPPPTTTKSNESAMAPPFFVFQGWAFARFLARAGGSLHLSPCGRGRIASQDAIRVRGCDPSLGRNPLPLHLKPISCSDRHKIPKRSVAGLSKAALHWYIPLAPKGICPGCLLRKPPDGIDRRPWAWTRFVSGQVFEGAQWFIAGWSSPVARQAHNLKVIGSNPIPATKL
jgi:hypothetical protein